MGERLGVRGDQGGDIRAVVADHDALADGGTAAQPFLQHGRGDVLAARIDEDVLLPAGDGEIAVLVEGAEVARREPLPGQDGVRGGRVVPVRAEDRTVLDQALPVVGDARTVRRAQG
ncbi:hypothetical protein GCM10010448_62370 [Streptomyces glomeratus]|uniref:Uncharacterized protein n=1 Tax=Streptomyces glomeratus TaxID=284452 RepID=A0ABP6M0T7_9ACTN